MEAFAGRDWVPVASILTRLMSDASFGGSALRTSAASSAVFQVSSAGEPASKRCMPLPKGHALRKAALSMTCMLALKCHA